MSISRYEKVKTFKYLGSLLTNQNYIQEEIKCTLKTGNSFYYSVQTLLYPRLLSKINTKKICFCTDGKISVRINLPSFSTVVPAIIFMFLSCRPFVAITTLSTGLVGVEVTSGSWLGQLTVGV